MAQTMTKDTVNVEKIANEAYQMGYKHGPTEDLEDPEISYWTESATFINTIAPKLRLMSGFKQNSMGTHTEDREVKTEEHGQMKASDIYNYTIHDAYCRGWYDKAEGEEASYE